MSKQAGRARDEALRRRQLRYDEVARSIDARTRTGEWEVETPNRKPVVRTRHGVVRLGPDEVTPEMGGPGVRILAHSLLLVWQRWQQTLLRDTSAQLYYAAVTASDRQGCSFELLPAAVIWNRPQPLLEAQSWTGPLRAVGPVLHRRTQREGMLVTYELTDQANRLLVSETRRYTRPQGPGQRHPIMQWTIRLHDNPLPDLWLLAILTVTTRSILAQP